MNTPQHTLTIGIDYAETAKEITARLAIAIAGRHDAKPPGDCRFKELAAMKIKDACTSKHSHLGIRYRLQRLRGTCINRACIALLNRGTHATTHSITCQGSHRTIGHLRLSDFNAAIQCRAGTVHIDAP